MENCIFCKIIKGKVPGSKIYEDDEILVFMDTQPINRGHTLIIPKKHSSSPAETDDKTLSKMITMGKKVGIAIRKSTIRCEGIDFFIADGESAGQTVFHIHLHIIPRFENDGFSFRFPPGYISKPNRKELDSLAKEIKKCITNTN